MSHAVFSFYTFHSLYFSVCFGLGGLVGEDTIDFVQSDSSSSRSSTHKKKFWILTDFVSCISDISTNYCTEYNLQQTILHVFYTTSQKQDLVFRHSGYQSYLCRNIFLNFKFSKPTRIILIQVDVYLLLQDQQRFVHLKASPEVEVGFQNQIKFQEINFVTLVNFIFGSF